MLGGRRGMDNSALDIADVPLLFAMKREAEAMQSKEEYEPVLGCLM